MVTVLGTDTIVLCVAPPDCLIRALRPLCGRFVQVQQMTDHLSTRPDGYWALEVRIRTGEPARVRLALSPVQPIDPVARVPADGSRGGEALRAQRDRGYYQEIGRRGGQATRDHHPGHLARISARGGQAILRLYGPEWFRQLARDSHRVATGRARAPDQPATCRDSSHSGDQDIPVAGPGPGNLAPSAGPVFLPV